MFELDGCRTLSTFAGGRATGAFSLLFSFRTLLLPSTSRCPVLLPSTGRCRRKGAELELFLVDGNTTSMFSPPGSALVLLSGVSDKLDPEPMSAGMELRLARSAICARSGALSFDRFSDWLLLRPLVDLGREARGGVGDAPDAPDDSSSCELIEDCRACSKTEHGETM